MRNKGIEVFGSPSYLVNKFDDVDRAVVSRKSAMSKLIVATVEGLATEKDDMRVYRVMKTTGKFDGRTRAGYVAHVEIGLNGPGRQEDYLAALQRLVTCKTLEIRVFDAWVDAVDDLVDVLVYCTDAADMPKKGPAK